MKILFLCISFLSALCVSLYSPIACTQKLPPLRQSLTTLQEKLGALSTQLQDLKRLKPKTPTPAPPPTPQYTTYQHNRRRPQANQCLALRFFHHVSL